MTSDDYKKYAELIVAQGVSLYEGQCLEITCGLEHYDFALLVAETAYKKGAKLVEIKVTSNKLTRLRIENAKGDLDYIPDYERARVYEHLANDWAYLYIDNTEEVDVLSGVDAEKLEKMVKAFRKARKPRMDALVLNKFTWCIVAAPGPKWAAKVLECEPSSEADEKLSFHLKKILRLDQPDPVKAWDEHTKNIKKRGKVLTELKLDKVIFKSGETNLEIGLVEGAEWSGGGDLTLDGRIFSPNIPSEEVFTTPDYRRAEGKVVVTRPLKVMESMVEGAWFEFKDGKVIASGASKGADVLEKYLAIDEGASMLGEVALVDCDSPIFQSNLLFSSILYDENASSHIALGNGYIACLPDYNLLLTDEQKKEAGCNLSLVHTDFMIGSDDMDVIGVDKNGKETVIIKSGKFRI